MTTIWVLFSVDNNYDQPDHNLVAWWPERPTLDVIEGLQEIVTWDAKDRPHLAIALLSGQEVMDSNYTRFRLQQIGPGAPPARGDFNLCAKPAKSKPISKIV